VSFLGIELLRKTMGKTIKGKDNVAAFLSRWYSLAETTFSIEVTNRCSLSCKGCWIFNTKERLEFPVSDHIMSPSQIKELLLFGRAVGLDKVQFVGGEPLLNAHLASFVSSARRFGFQRVAVTSNGVAPWARYENLVENGLTDLSFSLDGATKESHDRLRPAASGVSSFDKTIANIKRSVKEYMMDNLKIRINHTIYPGNFPEAESMIRLSAALGVKSIRVHFAFPGDIVFDEVQASSLIENWLIKPERWLIFVARCDSLHKELGIRIYIPQIYGFFEIDRIPLIRPGYLQVRPDNTLLMCNTHDRLPYSKQRWFARVTGADTIEVNEESIVFDNMHSSMCCKAIPILIKDFPKCVQAALETYGGLGCIYLPSPLITRE
jgi:sulfatase maturation enzyme AslB (radical SAM superfamily)